MKLFKQLKKSLDKNILDNNVKEETHCAGVVFDVVFVSFKKNMDTKQMIYEHTDYTIDSFNNNLDLTNPILTANLPTMADKNIGQYYSKVKYLKANDFWGIYHF